MRKTDFVNKIQQIADALGWEANCPSKRGDANSCVMLHSDGYRLEVFNWGHHIRLVPIMPLGKDFKRDFIISGRMSAEQIETEIKEKILPTYYRDCQEEKEKIEKEQKRREEQRENANRLAEAMGLKSFDVYDLKERKEMIMRIWRLKTTLRSDGAVTIEIVLNKTEQAVRILKRLL